MWNQSSLDNSYEIYEGMHFHLDVLKVISIVISFTKVDPEDLSVKEDECTSHEDDEGDASCNHERC